MSLQQQLELSATTTPEDRHALQVENEELRAQLLEEEEATAAALQEMMEMQMRYAEVVSGRSPDNAEVELDSDRIYQCVRSSLEASHRIDVGSDGDRHTQCSLDAVGEKCDEDRLPSPTNWYDWEADKIVSYCPINV